MKYLILSLMILVCTSCAPFNVQLSIFQSNKYILGDEQTSSNKVLSVTSDEPSKSYGNGNKVIIHQMNTLYKSPTTNSSNSVPISVPLIPGM